MRTKGGRRKAGGGISRETTSRTAPLVSRCSQPAVRIVDSRLGVTLIELLIAIAIMATLSVMFLGASRAAMEHSRASRTKMTISKLHTLLMEQWASYETRRVDIDENITRPIDDLLNNKVISPKTHGEMRADLRLLAVRELMKFEMPDRWSDFDLSINPNGKNTSYYSYPDTATVFLKSTPTLARIYDRRLVQARNSPDNTEAEIIDNQRAECLYMVIMYACGDGESRTMFAAQDIGDVDDDGAPEFLDGWGNPIEYLRWPPGFYQRSAVMSGDSEGDHDPFDPFQRNSINALPVATAFPTPLNSGSIVPYIKRLRGSEVPTGGQVGFRLVPLIYSGGPDGVADIINAYEKVMSAPSSPDGVGLNPYFPNGPGDNYAMGAPHTEDGEDLSIDNIHNHLQEGR